MSTREVATVDDLRIERRRPLPLALLVSARPKQWVKNFFVLAPVGFAELGDVAAILRVVAATVAFCAVSSGLYVLNDVADRDLDRRHERKRHRPVASGELPVPAAVAAAVAAVVGGLLLGFAASPPVAALLLVYVALTLAYSWRLKHVVLIDVFVLASGFVIRVSSGALAAGVPPSEWLLLCTMFLALFLGFAKRRHELLLLGGDAGSHRPVLHDYTQGLLDQLLTTTLLGALITYSLYTSISPTARDHPGLMVTVPFVAYALFRYLALVHTRQGGGSPEELVLSDRALQVAIGLWGLAGLLVVYLGPG